MASIALRKTKVNTSGNLPTVGSPAPDFLLTDATLADKTLADFKGKKKLLNIVPSLDTQVCAVSTKKFNEYASAHPNVVMLIISADLPFAQKRFCDTEKLKNVIALSMMRSRDFAENYGVLLLDGPLAGITTRAVVVIDEQDKIIYTELVPDIAHEPNYSAALAALN